MNVSRIASLWPVWPFRHNASQSERAPDSLDPATMRGRIFDLNEKKLVRLDGFDLYVMPNDYVGAGILSSKLYEQHVTSVIRKELRQDDVFLDLGANLGYFTMLASSILTSGKVIIFEPNSQNLQLIYASMLENEARNLVVYPYAVSDAEKILRFVTVGSNGGVIGEYSKGQEYDVLVLSVILDKILKDEPRIDFVKIDIEAHEPFAVKGMAGLIKKHRPKIVTEFHPWAMRMNNSGEPIDYLKQITQLGYTLSIIKFDGDVIDVRGPDDVMLHWKSLGEETIHLDLFARPTELVT